MWGVRTGLENRCTPFGVPWIRIPPPPLCRAIVARWCGEWPRDRAETGRFCLTLLLSREAVAQTPFAGTADGLRERACAHAVGRANASTRFEIRRGGRSPQRRTPSVGHVLPLEDAVAAGLLIGHRRRYAMRRSSAVCSRPTLTSSSSSNNDERHLGRTLEFGSANFVKLQAEATAAAPVASSRCGSRPSVRSGRSRGL